MVFVLFDFYINMHKHAKSMNFHDAKYILSEYEKWERKEKYTTIYKWK